MRLVVQVLPAHRTEAGALVAAEDLVRELECQRVARPGPEVELVVDDVRRLELVGAVRVRGLILPGSDRNLEDRVSEAAVAGPVQPGLEGQLEDAAGRSLADRQVRDNLLGHGQVTLTAELEGLELELDLVAVLLPRPELDLP